MARGMNKEEASIRPIRVVEVEGKTACSFSYRCFTSPNSVLAQDGSMRGRWINSKIIEEETKKSHVCVAWSIERSIDIANHPAKKKAGPKMQPGHQTRRSSFCAGVVVVKHMFRGLFISQQFLNESWPTVIACWPPRARNSPEKLSRSRVVLVQYNKQLYSMKSLGS
jgi:hypothetical protein